MNLSRLIAFTLLACSASASSLAQEYPVKPIRMIVPFSPGGGVDIAARAVGAKMQESMGQPVVVENRPGAAGNIAMEATAKAANDGYTLIMGGAGPVAMNVGLYPKLPFDPVKDFAPVGLVASTVYALVVHPSNPAKSLKDLIAQAKAKPGESTFASPGTGAPPHLAGELLQSMAGIKMMHVPYKGTGPALNDLLAGQVTMYFADIIAARPFLESGKLRALGVTSAKRSPLAPEIPTIAEAGVPGYEAIGWTGLLAPAGTPPAVISRLNAEINRAIKQPDVAARLAGDGSEFGANTPNQFSNFIGAEIKKWRMVIQTAGVKLD